MIGLLVHLTADFAKIWSTSFYRCLTYSRDDVPDDSHEGDWVHIEFDSSGVMKCIKKRNALLKTERGERGKLQVLDVFLVDSRRQEAFSEIFGFVRIEKTKEGGKWTDEERTRDHCIVLWMTISSTAQFYLEEQSLDRANSKDGKYAHKYKSLMEALKRIEYREPIASEIDVSLEFEETILVVGHDHRTNVFFSSSRSGEAFINPPIWCGFTGENRMEKGAAFRARLNKQTSNPMHKVIMLYERVHLWDGVKVNVTDREFNVELNAEVVERRKTCFALDTEPFGLVTYSFDRIFSPNDVNIGDHLRVVLVRLKKDVKDDFPSKWQVTKITQTLKKAGKKKEQEWFEGVVTYVPSPVNALITFEKGTAFYKRNVAHGTLSLGDIVDITVSPTAMKDGCFDIIDMGDEIRKREDILVKHLERNKCIVFCIAEVIERRDSYFLLETPIIGLVLFFFKEAPREMEVGDVWRIKMLRRKDKQGYPSHWVATDIAGEFPRVSSLSSRRRDDWNEEECASTSRLSSRNSQLSTPIITPDHDWTIVLITGSDGGVTFACCATADPIKIPKTLIRNSRELLKGSFYRVKLSVGSDGKKKAYDLDPEEVFPKDIARGSQKANTSLQMMCYSRIVNVQESAFTVRNKILGDAILPFKFASRELRVGDELETLYYRVRTTKNPTHWMVQNAKVIRGERYCRGKDEEWSKESHIEEERFPAYNEEDDPVEESPPIRRSMERMNEMESSSSEKDRRMIDLTRHFMNFPEVHKLFRDVCPDTLKRIELFTGHQTAL